MSWIRKRRAVMQSFRMVHSYSKHISIGIFCASFIIFTVVLPLYADIFIYIDKGGCAHLTNIPTSSKYRLFIKERPAKSSMSYSTDRFDNYMKEASKRYKVAFPLLKAMVKVESNFNPKAVSKMGAKGLMQIMPENFKALRIKNPFDPRENIMAGARYIRQLLNRFNSKLRLALAAYHAGPNKVDHFKDVPPIKETEDYVRKVMKYYRIFKTG